jgi:hypothetical protein
MVSRLLFCRAGVARGLGLLQRRCRGSVIGWSKSLWRTAAGIKENIEPRRDADATEEIPPGPFRNGGNKGAQGQLVRGERGPKYNLEPRRRIRSPRG